MSLSLFHFKTAHFPFLRFAKMPWQRHHRYHQDPIDPKPRLSQPALKPCYAEELEKHPSFHALHTHTLIY